MVFFCKIPFPDNLNLLPILFTNNDVLNENDIKIGKTIKFTLHNDNIKKIILIDSTRKTYTNKELDITIIEIKKNNDKINIFLEIDDKLKDYKNKQVYTI